MVLDSILTRGLNREDLPKQFTSLINQETYDSPRIKAVKTSTRKFGHNTLSGLTFLQSSIF